VQRAAPVILVPQTYWNVERLTIERQTATAAK